jgi:hypothetical protein
MIVGMRTPARRTFGDTAPLVSLICSATGGAVTSATDELKALKWKLAVGIIGVAIAGIACVASAMRGPTR